MFIRRNETSKKIIVNGQGIAEINHYWIGLLNDTDRTYLDGVEHEYSLLDDAFEKASFELSGNEPSDTLAKLKEELVIAVRDEVKQAISYDYDDTVVALIENMPDEEYQEAYARITEESKEELELAQNAYDKEKKKA